MKATDNLLAWRALLVTARTGSVTHAAIELGLEVPRVSRMIKGIEAEIGPLVNRKARPLKLTELGELVVADIPGILSAQERLLNANGVAVDQKTILRISAPSSLGRLFITKQILQYGSRNRNLEFELQVQKGLLGILNNTTDVAYMKRPPENDLINIYPISTYRPFPMSTPQYLKEHGEPRTPEDLKEHIGLLHRGGLYAPNTTLLSGTQSRFLSWKRVFIFDDQSNIVTALTHHAGIAIDLSGTICLPELGSGRFVPVLREWRCPLWEFCVVTRREKEEQSPAVKEFLQWWIPLLIQGSKARADKAEKLQREYWAQYSASK